jgi:hypothetical protein
MITIERSSAASNGRPSDELDGLLRGYFQAELPLPWPAFNPPRHLNFPATRAEPNSRAGRWQLHSRLMLVAASVALFLAAQFLLPNFVPTDNKDNTRPAAVDTKGDPTADLKDNDKIIREEIIREEIQWDGGEAFLKFEAFPKEPGRK